MNKEGYTLFSTNEKIYTFESVGRYGKITKAVVFQEIDTKLYNLVLIDRDTETGHWMDDSVTNNGDLTKVMITVSKIILLFLDIEEGVKIFIQANSKSRNKLYHRIMRNYHEEFMSELKIEATINGDIENFEIGKIYESFYICKK